MLSDQDIWDCIRPYIHEEPGAYDMLRMLEVDEVPEKYRVTPKNRTLYRGMLIAKPCDMKDFCFYDRSYFVSYTSSVSAAKDFARGLYSEQPVRLRLGRSRDTKIGIVFKRTVTPADIWISIGTFLRKCSLPLTKEDTCHKYENEYLSRNRREAYTQDDVVWITKKVRDY